MSGLHILVVEDEAFQRLQMIEILSIMDLQVTTAVNGRVAWEMLLSQQQHFDIILLDLVMPEVDGLELLEMIKDDPDLKQIPVIMMSGNNQMDSIYACIDKGAVDFLIKPIRPGAVKGLISQISLQQHTASDAGESETGLKAYDVLQSLGKGAYGSVQLVRKRSTGELFALKKIDCTFLSEKERRNSENEATLQKVLMGPTIIRFFEQFTEDNALYIVMEYGEGGTLADKLKEYCDSGQKVPADQAIAWISQIVLALMLMHSKHILHRDLKTQNLFLSRSNVIKVGDFGIAKALNHTADVASTVTGTPYFMAPEICRGEQYGQKTDIWALGCILYEIVTFKKPFDDRNMQAVFERILKRQMDPLPQDEDPNIQLLISTMLQADPNQRPTVWELANIPKIRDYIYSFVIEENCQDTMLPLLEHDPRSRGMIQTQTTSPKTQLDQIGRLAKGLIPMSDRKIGWFGKVYKNVFNGEDLSNFCQERFGFSQAETINTLQDMLDQGFIFSLNQNPGYSHNEPYQFREDRDDLGRNLIYIWTKEVRMPQDVSYDLVSTANQCIQNYNGDLNTIKQSTEYLMLLQDIGEIQRLEIKHLTRIQKIEFFMNIYQVMLLHQMVELKDVSKGWFSDPSNNFFYCIAGQNYTLKEIKHGVLRGNQKPPDSYSRVFSNNDPRNVCANFNDPRVLIVCQDPPIQLIPFLNFKDNLEEMLETFVQRYCKIEVCLNVATEEVILPKLFQTYQADFGGSQEAMITWIWKYLTTIKVTAQQVIDGINSQRLYLHYRD